MNQEIKKIANGDFEVAHSMSLKNFEEILKNHDWYHQMSDNRHIADQGWRKEAEIKAIALQSPEHSKLYQQYLKLKFPKSLG